MFYTPRTVLSFEELLAAFSLDIYKCLFRKLANLQYLSSFVSNTMLASEGQTKSKMTSPAMMLI